jgi:DNA-binding NtrC family response regulator
VFQATRSRLASPHFQLDARLGTRNALPIAIQNIVPSPTRQTAVLVVDDDPMLLDLVVDYIGDRFAVTLATDARDALAKFHHRSFDAVVVDRAMPELLGDGFALQIKEQSPHMPIILITGFRGVPADPALFASMLHKPFTQAELLTALHDALPTANA